MLSLPNTHHFSINALQSVADRFGWPLGYGRLSPQDVQLLKTGVFGSLNWKWALDTYGVPLPDTSNGIFDVSIKIVDSSDNIPGAVVLCQLDTRRSRFGICMMENFKRREKTPLSNRVWLSSLIYAHTFAKSTKMEEIYIINPTDENLPRYRSFGFYEDATCPPHMSATVDSVEAAIKQALS